MTEKRFSIKAGSSIGLSSIYTDNGKVMTQLEVLDVLIKQHETIQTLTKENEQLKQFKSKVLELLDEKIKHYEYKPFSAPVGQPMSVNFDADVDRIARLSELQDLKKELEE